MSDVLETMKARLYAFPGAAADSAAAQKVLLYKVMGKMFAIWEPKLANLIVKCDPHLVDVLKETYDGVGHRGHLDRRFWICINLRKDVPYEEAERLVAGSYDLIVSGLTKKQKAELAALG